MGVGRVPIREGRYSGGNEGITKLKTNVISAAAERKQCLFILFYFLLSEVCLAACSRGWVKHCGMTLLLNIFVLFGLFGFSPNTEMLSLQTEEERREQGRFLYWKRAWVSED